jgi:transcriptional regulator with XRE-family HTH domain
MTISKIERGERAPSLAMLRRLAEALDVPPGLLLDEGGGPARAKREGRRDKPTR